MPPSGHRAQRHGRAKRTVAGLAAVLALTVWIPLVGMQPVHAQTSAPESINVHIGTDGSIESVSKINVNQTGSSSASPSGALQELDPATEADKLPVRVVTTWSHDGTSGTDLDQLRGQSGQFTVRVNVENLLVSTKDVSTEQNGAKYQKAALVGTPLTVAMATHFASDSGVTNIVTDSTAQPTTNGTVGVSDSSNANAGGQQSVQWAAWLAPPLLPPSATFTLVFNADKLVPPSFDLMVEPDLVSDPSLGNVLSKSMGVNSSAASARNDAYNLVLDLNDELFAAEQLVQQIYNQLASDANNIGQQTIEQLHSASDTMLGQITETQSELKSLQDQVQSQLKSSQSQTSSSLNSMLSQMETNVLGDPSTTPKLTPGSIDGCNITYPTLATDQPKTLSNAVQTIRAQVDALASAYAPASGSSTGGACRTQLVEKIKDIIGTVGVCPTNGTMTVGCTLSTAHNTLASVRGQLSLLYTSLSSALTDHNADVTELNSKLRTLFSQLDALKTDMSNTSTDLSNGLATANSNLSTMLTTANTAQAAVTSLSDYLNSSTSGLATSTAITALTANITRLTSYLSNINGTNGMSNATLAQSGATANLGTTLTDLGTAKDYIGDAASCSLVTSGALKNVCDAQTSLTPTGGSTGSLSSVATGLGADTTSLTLAKGHVTDASTDVAAIGTALNSYTSLSNPYAVAGVPYLRTLVAAANTAASGSCPANGIWDRVSGTTLSASSNMSAVLTALTTLGTSTSTYPSCSVAPMAKTLADLMSNLNTAQTAITGAQSSQTAASTALNGGTPVTGTATPSAVSSSLGTLAGHASIASTSVASASTNTTSAIGDLSTAVTGLGNAYTKIGDIQTTDLTALASNLSSIDTALTYIHDQISGTAAVPGTGTTPGTPADPGMAAELATTSTNVGNLVSDLRTALNPTLDALFKQASSTTPASGYLADLATSISGLQTELSSTGDVGKVVGEINALESSLASIYTPYAAGGVDEPWASVSDATDAKCTAEKAADTSAATTPTLNATAILSNRVLCEQSRMSTAVSTLNSTTIPSVDTSINTVTDAENGLTALTASTTTQIDASFGTLVGQLGQFTTGDNSIVGQNLGLIAQSRTDLEKSTQQIIDSYTSSTNKTIQMLVDGITQANTESEATRQQLSDSLTALINNLGSTDPNSRTGLLGQLRTSSARVLDITTLLQKMLDALAQQGTQTHGDLVKLQLQSAAWDASKASLDDLTKSGQAVIYTFHLGAN
jgi:hypothetical protein